MNAFKTMLKTELKLSLRGMDMLIFAVCLPVVLTIILGVIYGDKPAFEGAGYSFLEQSFGAISTISVCAGGVMGLPLVISDYRHKKILKRFKVTPVSPAMILMVQVTIYALYCAVSLILVFLTARLFFGFQMQGSWILFAAVYLLVMASMFSIGLLVGGLSPDIKTASMAASILYFPMLIFSGATLPYEIMPKSLQTVANIMPLTQGIKLLKSVSLGLPAENVIIPIVTICALGIICTLFSLKFFRWE